VTPLLIKRIQVYTKDALKSLNEISVILPDTEDPYFHEFIGEIYDVSCAVSALNELNQKLKERESNVKKTDL